MNKEKKILPSGWKEFRLGDVATFRRGSFPQPYGLAKWFDAKNGTPFVQVFDVDKNMKLKEKTKTKISELAKPFSVFIPQNTVIITIQGSIGRVALTQYDAYVDRTLLLFQEYKENINKIYFIHILEKLFNIEKRKAPGGTLKTITKEVLKNFKISIPPIEEQERIAEVLGCADSVIELTISKIEQLKLQKKSLMQKLLTPKPHWVEKKVGDLGEISSAGVDKKIISGEARVNLLNYMDVYKKNLIGKNDLHQVVSCSKSKKKSCDLKKGDLFFTPSSETREDIAQTALLIEDIPNSVYSYHIYRLRCNDNLTDILFRSFMCKTDIFKRQSYRLASGGGQRYVMSQDNFRNIKISIPPLKEQEEIAEVLKTQDAVISLNEQKLQNLKLQKKSLMQKLLTGEWRVK